MVERAALVSGDMIGLVALDLVLWIVLGRAMRMALVIEIAGMDGDNRSTPGLLRNSSSHDRRL